ncbi:MAG: rhodanese-like domain-containing protein [Clostridia bacterium]
MKRTMITIFIILAVFLTGCQKTEEQGAVYMKIDQATAKTNMETRDDIILLDVRTEYEHDEIRIPGSMLLPDYDIGRLAPTLLPDKDAEIYVYCRSGARSREAVMTLLGMGYTNVYDLGGIIDWPYETE